MTAKTTNGFQKALEGDQKSLAIVLNQMAKFDRRFCEAMMDGVDFTLRLEVHGNKSQVIHVRVYDDEFDRPFGSDHCPHCGKKAYGKGKQH